jgi:hypothetical protein
MRDHLHSFEFCTLGWNPGGIPETPADRGSVRWAWLNVSAQDEALTKIVEALATKMNGTAQD